MIDRQLYEAMEDHDNWGLSTKERKDQLEDAVRNFNEEYGTNYNPEFSYLKYELERMKPEL